MRLVEIYGNFGLDTIVKYLLYAYLLTTTTKINKGSGADIFLDNRSVCYSKISIIDIV